MLVAIFPKMVFVPIGSVWIYGRLRELVLVNKLRRLFLSSIVYPKFFLDLGFQVHIFHSLSQGHSLFLLHPAKTSLHICSCWDDI
tara:strand:- start:88 stop:342 length:255 start_codon:yes stop_codon:yes gene_type:complete